MTDTAKRMIEAAKTEALFASARAAILLEALKAELLAKMRRVHYDASIAGGVQPKGCAYFVHGIGEDGMTTRDTTTEGND